MSADSARRSLRGRWLMSRPSKVIAPPVTGARPSTARPSVVLPEPDSPTRPTVSPGKDVEGDAVQGAERLLAEALPGVLDDEVVDVEQSAVGGHGVLAHASASSSWLV